MRRSIIDNSPGVLTRWLSVSLPALAFILVPFFLFGARMDGWAMRLLEHRTSTWLVIGVVVLLLVSDVVLPIPSSLISTMAGAMLGAPTGAVASWLGMTLGCVVGYAVGAFAGRAFVERLAGPGVMGALEKDMSRLGMGIVAAGRAVPVLAEATTLIAGASRMPMPKFLAVSSVANLAVSVAYASVGALSAEVGSFLLAITGSMLLPAIAWWIVRRYHRSGRPAN